MDNLDLKVAILTAGSVDFNKAMRAANTMAGKDEDFDYRCHFPKFMI